MSTHWWMLPGRCETIPILFQTISVVPAPGLTGNATPYPPIERFFDHQSDPVARYLWRWIGYLAPDLVVELRSGDTTEWRATDLMTAERFASSGFGFEDESLLGALGNGAGDAPGAIPGLRITALNGELGVEIGRLLAIVNKVGG